MIGVLFCIFFLALIINIPVAFCLGLGVLAATFFKTSLPLSIVPLKMYSMLNSFPLLAIPLYVLAGNLMNKGKITLKLVNLAKALIGSIKGGLAITTVLASMFFGGVSGSSIADTAAIGSVLAPELKKEGYDKNFSAGLIASAGTLGGIIPPSIPMVLYGIVAETSIAKLFLAGAIPGILLGIFFMLVCYIISKKYNYPVSSKPTLRSVIKAFYKGLLPLGMPILIIGGIYGGVLTATEAGILAVLYALIAGVLIYKTIKVNDILDSIIETAKISSIPCLIIAFSGSFAFLNTYADIPRSVSTFIYYISSNKIIVLLLINFMLLIMGMFMDGAAIYPIVVPIFLPVLMKMGISPIHFGVIIVLNLSIGLITPPVGATLYTACAVTGLEPLGVAKKAFPFLLVALIVLMLVTFIPCISEWVPSLLGN
jgi:C4-dicarboxylate transporter DctM subunit